MRRLGYHDRGASPNEVAEFIDLYEISHHTSA